MYEENIPKDWKDSFNTNCYKGKGYATDRENYRSLKLLEHVMKVVEHFCESLIHSKVDIINMSKLGIYELIARLMKAMYNVADLRARVNGCFNKRFEVTVGVHQGSVLSLLLFAIVMEALSLSHDCCIGCPW